MQPKFLLIAGGAALGLATPAAAQMDHSNMPGMDHSRMNAPGGQGATQGQGAAQGGQKRQPAQPSAQQRRSN